MGATRWMQLFQLRRSPEEESEETKLLKALYQAEKEYNVAVAYFREATEPEIIDEAIFRMEAARRKYSYFLKRVRSCSSRN